MSMTMDSFASSVRRFSPRLLLSELLLKQWFEPVIPFTVMIGLWFYFALTVTDYATVKNSLSLLRLFAEFGFVAHAAQGRQRSYSPRDTREDGEFWRNCAVRKYRSV